MEYAFIVMICDKKIFLIIYEHPKNTYTHKMPSIFHKCDQNFFYFTKPFKNIDLDLFIPIKIKMHSFNLIFICKWLGRLRELQRIVTGIMTEMSAKESAQDDLRSKFLCHDLFPNLSQQNMVFTKDLRDSTPLPIVLLMLARLEMFFKFFH